MTIYAIVAGIIAVIVAIVGAFTKGKQSGRDGVAAEKAKEDAQLQMEFDKIDAGKPDVDGAFDRLRKRAERNNRP